MSLTCLHTKLATVPKLHLYGSATISFRLWTTDNPWFSSCWICLLPLIRLVTSSFSTCLKTSMAFKEQHTSDLNHIYWIGHNKWTYKKCCRTHSPWTLGSRRAQCFGQYCSHSTQHQLPTSPVGTEEFICMLITPNCMYLSTLVRQLAQSLVWERCVAEIKVWLVEHKLKLNDDKTVIVEILSPWATASNNNNNNNTDFIYRGWPVKLSLIHHRALSINWWI